MDLRGSHCTFLLSLLARAFAIMVLPVPGGPWNNITIPAPYVIASSSPMRFRQRLYASKLLTVFKISCFCSLGRITYRKHTTRAVIFKTDGVVTNCDSIHYIGHIRDLGGATTAGRENVIAVFGYPVQPFGQGLPCMLCACQEPIKFCDC